MRLSYPRLLEWWTDDPADPDRPLLHDPDVQRLVAAIASRSCATDLGGVMSLNVRLDAAGLVLRVHQPFVSRQRLLALQQVRRHLAAQGLLVSPPVRWKDAMVFRVERSEARKRAYGPGSEADVATFRERLGE